MSGREREFVHVSWRRMPELANRLRWTGRMNFGVRLAVGCLLVVGCGTRPAGARPLVPTMVLAPTALSQEAFGLGHADILTEVPYGRVPRVVRLRVAEATPTPAGRHYEVNCTEYYTNGALYFAVLLLGCDPDRLYFDADALLVITAQGETRSELIEWPDTEKYYSYRKGLRRPI